MHSNGKGMSSSALPYKRTPPSWVKTTAAEVNDQICKFAKKGQTPSQIGVLLRDSMGIPQVKSVTGSKILRILKASGLAPEIPEDVSCTLLAQVSATCAIFWTATLLQLYHLIKKAVAMRKHLERNRKDKDGKFRLILVESRIHRLARYYKVRFCPKACLPCNLGGMMLTSLLWQRVRKVPPTFRYESATASTLVA
jgi:small subunit ribosomal protein S13e